MNLRSPLYIVYHCYGNEAFFHECLFSILSLCRLYKPEELRQVEIWIYTDNPEWFARFRDCPVQLRYRKITAAEIKEWQGPHSFNFRSKIELARDFVKNKTGNILYLDTDTIFTHRIEKMVTDIEGGKLYMHTMEGLVKDEGDNILKKLHKLLQSGPVTIKGKTIPIPTDIAMWNAGVLGYNTQYAYLPDEALDFTDEVYPRFRKHTVEQFAFSVVFANTGPVHMAAPYLLHYWCIKEIRPVMASFFSYMPGKSWEELVYYSQMIQIPVYLQEKISFLHNRTLAGKIQKLQWRPVMPDWQRLMKQL